MTKRELMKRIENEKTKSAWKKGVKNYALDLVDGLELDELPETWEELKALLLNGADGWLQYSWGGCALIYDADIAKALCTPSELKKTRNGERKPNSGEEWLDVQGRALFQASRLIHSCYRFAEM